MTNNVNYGIFLDDERIPEDVYYKLTILIK